MAMKEELRSLNERLSAVDVPSEKEGENHEHREDDINNLSSGAKVVTLFLDTAMRPARLTLPNAQSLDLLANGGAQSLADLLPNYYDDTILDDANQVLQHLRPLDKELTARDGRRYVRRIRPSRNPDNCVDGVIINFLDTGERKFIERAADREQRLAAILDALPDAVIGISLEGVITEFNSTAEGLFECPAHKASGQLVQSFLQPGPTQPVAEDVMHLLESRTTADSPTLLCEGVRTSGEVFPVVLRGTKIDNLGVRVLLVRDITEQQQQDQQIINICNREQVGIGKVIHEGLGQQLAGLTMVASVLANKLQKAERPEAAEAKDLAQKIAKAFASSKTVIQGLSPVGVDPKRFIDALKTLAHEVRATSGVSCEVHCETELRATDRIIASHLYRIVQEAIKNALDHGAASHVDIRLERTEGHLWLSVFDNGKWASRPKGGASGFGMHIMSYRAGLLGGKIKVELPPLGGTLVRCEVPLTVVEPT